LNVPFFKLLKIYLYCLEKVVFIHLTFNNFIFFLLSNICLFKKPTDMHA